MQSPTINADVLIQFVGRLHPMLVHFPIALLVVLALAELGRSIRAGSLHRPTRSPLAGPLLTLGMLAAVAAAITGWLNAEAEGQLADRVFWHRWLSIGVAVLSLASFFVSFAAARDQERGINGIYRLLLFGCALLLTVSGHLGAELTHGRGYLTAPFAAKPAAAPTELVPGTDAPAPALNEPMASPLAGAVAVFEARCYECHGPEKRKGGLRLDDLTTLFAGPEEERVVVPGDASSSLLYELIGLPDDDMDRMPPKGDPLTESQIAAIRTWIEAGAPTDAASGS